MDIPEELFAFLALKRAKTDKQIEEAIEEFNQMAEDGSLEAYMSNNFIDNEQSDEYLFMAYEAKTPAQAKKYFKKALEINHQNIDAKLGLVELEKAPFKKLEQLVELKNEALGILFTQSDITDEDFGSFWGIIETRPLLRVCHVLMKHLEMIDFVHQALAAGEEILYLNESDNMGVRYELINYCYQTANVVLAFQLAEKFQDMSPLFVIPYLGILLRSNETERAIELVKNAEQSSPGFIKYFSNITDDKLFDAFEFASNASHYSLGEQEFMLALDKNGELIEDTELEQFLKKNFGGAKRTSPRPKKAIKH